MGTKYRSGLRDNIGQKDSRMLGWVEKQNMGKNIVPRERPNNNRSTAQHGEINTRILFYTCYVYWQGDVRIFDARIFSTRMTEYFAEYETGGRGGNCVMD